MMASLSNFKMSAKERLEKAKQVPLPSPTIGNTGAFRAKSAAQETATPPSEPALKAGQGSDAVKADDPKPSTPPVSSPNKSSVSVDPAPTPALDRSPRAKTATLQTHRPLLQFAEPMLPRAEAIAEAMKVKVEMLVHKVANETLVESGDFSGEDPAPRGGKVYRGTVRIEKDLAKQYLAEADPLSLHDEGLTLRPVFLRAFDRTANRVLAVLEQKLR